MLERHTIGEPVPAYALRASAGLAVALRAEAEPVNP